MTLVGKTAKTAKVGTTLPPWLAKHREAVSKPIIDNFVDAVRKVPGTSKVAAIGFCWGGRYALLAARGGPGGVDAAVACHPSLMSVPADLEGITKPVSVALGDKDSLVDEATTKKIEEYLNGKDFPHEVKIYPGQIHGFALRSDWSNEHEKKAMDDSEKQAIAWFSKYLAY